MVPKAAVAAALVDSTRISPRGAFLAKRSVVLPARVAASKNDTLSSDNDVAEDDTKNDAKKKKKKKKIVVVGAGWGGWGAAKAVAESETASVVLLDGVPDPTGRTGTRATSGKPFEAGVRGFWKDYPNINHLVVRERRRIAEVLSSSKSRRRHFFSLPSLCLSVSLVYF
jgi:NADPH-dependent 2,4-dienoyl-CoA reductase/sulfur reductase-like enzyme